MSKSMTIRISRDLALLTALFFAVSVPGTALAEACYVEEMELIGLHDDCIGDTDEDGICDEEHEHTRTHKGTTHVTPFPKDNCPIHQNPRQIDSDTNGLGNACDIDVNGDTLVDSLDFATMMEAQHSMAENSTYVAKADMDCNNTVDMFDLQRFLTMFP